jgi:hypothetical protein
MADYIRSFLEPLKKTIVSAISPSPVAATPPTPVGPAPVVNPPEKKPVNVLGVRG